MAQQLRKKERGCCTAARRVADLTVRILQIAERWLEWNMSSSLRRLTRVPLCASMACSGTSTTAPRTALSRRSLSVSSATRHNLRMPVNTYSEVCSMVQWLCACVHQQNAFVTFSGQARSPRVVKLTNRARHLITHDCSCTLTCLSLSRSNDAGGAHGEGCGPPVCCRGERHNRPRIHNLFTSTTQHKLKPIWPGSTSYICLASINS